MAERSRSNRSAPVSGWPERDRPCGGCRGRRAARLPYPHVRVGLRASASEELVEQVVQGAVDVAFLGLPTTAQPRGVESRELARDRLIAVVAPDHPLAGRATVELRRLSSEVFVDLPARTAGRLQSDEAFAAAGLQREVAFEVTTAYLIARLVEQGLGIAMLPSAYAPQLSGVATIEVVDAPARVEHVVWSRDGRTPAATAFLDVLDVLDVLGIPAGSTAG